MGKEVHKIYVRVEADGLEEIEERVGELVNQAKVLKSIFDDMEVTNPHTLKVLKILEADLRRLEERGIDDEGSGYRRDKKTVI